MDADAYAPSVATKVTKKDPQDPASEFNTFVENKMKADHVVGLSIAVLDDQNIVFAKGFGYADKAAGRMATANTLYRAGSISKLFTATAIMQLAEAARIDIDAPLKNALPNFSIRSRFANAPAITPRMIMTHHSGLPTDYMEGMWSDHPQRFTTLIDTLHDEYTAFAPNQLFSYSNLGFTLLGAAVEHTSGANFEDYMQSHLLMPLGMQASAFETQAPAETRAYDNKGEPAHEASLRDIPAGGLNTSVSDLVKFAPLWFANEPLKENHILGTQSINEMQRRQNGDVALDGDLFGGLAWSFAQGLVEVDGPVLAHDGATMNHRAVLIVLPKQKLAVAVLSNSANAATAVFAQRALALFLKSKYSANIPPKQTQPPEVSRYTLSPSKEYPGSYFTNWGFVSIHEKHGNLLANIGGKTMYLKPQESGYFRLQYKWLGLIPIDIGFFGTVDIAKTRVNGLDVLITRNSGKVFLFGSKITPKQITAPWKNRLGDYEYVGNDELIKKQHPKIGVSIENQFLIADVHLDQGSYKLVVAPANDNELVIQGLGRGLGGTIEVQQQGAGEVIKYSGMTFRRVTKEHPL